MIQTSNVIHDGVHEPFEFSSLKPPYGLFPREKKIRLAFNLYIRSEREH